MQATGTQSAEKVTSLRLSTPDRERVDAIARREHRTTAAQLRLWVEQAIDRHEKEAA